MSEFLKASQLYDESLAYYRELGYKQGIVLVHIDRGYMACEQEDCIMVGPQITCKTWSHNGIRRIVSKDLSKAAN